MATRDTIQFMLGEITAEIKALRNEVVDIKNDFRIHATEIEKTQKINQKKINRITWIISAVGGIGGTIGTVVVGYIFGWLPSLLKLLTSK